MITGLKNSNKIEILHMGEKEWFKNDLTKVFTLPRHCSTTLPTFYCIKVIPVSVSLTPLSADVICKRFLITVFNHELILFSFGKWVVLIDSFSHILCVIISKLERARSRTDVNCKHKIDKLRSNAVSGQAKSI